MRETYFTDFQLGIHSQIPTCCVYFYCEMLHAGGALLLARINETRRRAHPGKRFAIGYVACSDCWARITAGSQNPTQIHTCRDPNADSICAYMLKHKAAAAPQGTR